MEKMENNGENSGPLTLLPVDPLNGCNTDARANYTVSTVLADISYSTVVKHFLPLGQVPYNCKNTARVAYVGIEYIVIHITTKLRSKVFSLESL